ncbi:MAG TPA: hypothetical protein VJJ24_00175 [Candidatus Paceibacterota bacterium]
MKFRYNTQIGFSYDIARHGYAVLGQRGFFDRFKVTFDYQIKSLEIKEKISTKQL